MTETAPPDRADTARRALEQAPRELLIDGRWRPASGRAVYEVIDPATGQALAQVASATSADSIAALAAADTAAHAWAATPAAVRARMLRRVSDSLARRAEPLAALVALNTGSSLAEATIEAQRAATAFERAASETLRIAGTNRISADGTRRLRSTYRPLGPALLVLAAEAPLTTAAWQAASALAAGCAIVLRPAAQTPMPVLALAETIRQAGLPDGVVAAVPCAQAPSIDQPILHDSRLGCLCYTGSLDTAVPLLRHSAQRALPVSLTLSGPAFFLVLADADLDTAVAAATGAVIRWNGQATSAPTALNVHASLADPFATRLADALGALVTGDPLESSVQVGPLLNAATQVSVAQAVSEAADAGALVLTGGAPLPGPGFGYRPTVLSGLGPSAPVAGAAVPGPVAAIVPFDDAGEALARASTSAPLCAAYVIGGDTAAAERVCEALATRAVAINTDRLPGRSVGHPWGSGALDDTGAMGGAAEFLQVQHLAQPLSGGSLPPRT